MVNWQPASPQILLLERDDLGLEFLAELVQLLAVDLDPLALHPRHHRDERPVDHLVDPRDPLVRQPGLEAGPQAQGHVRVLGGIFGGPVERHLVELDLLLARSADVLEGDAFVVEMLLGEIVHRMAVEAAGVEVEAHHQAVVDRRDLDPAAVEDDPVELEIVADLEDRRIFEKRLQLRQRRFRPESARAARESRSWPPCSSGM